LLKQQNFELCANGVFDAKTKGCSADSSISCIVLQKVMIVGSLVAPGTALPIKELVFLEFPPKPLVAIATQIQCAEDIFVKLASEVLRASFILSLKY
jgi:hypothetical protein